MAIMTDQTYKKIFITLAGLAIVLFVILLISLTLGISLQTKELWIGGLIVFLTIYLYYTTPLYVKVITIVISAIVIYIFLSQFLGWPMEWSMIISVITVALIISGHFIMG